MDPCCFLKQDDEKCGLPEFAPKAVSYMRLQHPDDLSDPAFTEGQVEEQDVLSFIRKPCEPGFFTELRLMYTSERELRPGMTERDDYPYKMYQPWPLTEETYKAVNKLCGFYTGDLFGRRLRTFKLLADGINSRSIINNAFGQSYMEILCSRNEVAKTTTIIVHNAMPAELRAIKEAMKRPSYWTLAQHPVFIFAVSIEILRSRLQVGLAWADTEAIKASRVAEKQADSNASVEMQSESVQAESRITLYRLHQIVQLMGDIKLAMHELSKVKAWCCEFDDSGETADHHDYFKNAGAIILGRLEDLEDSLQHADVQTQTILAFTQSSRQSLEIQLATINNKLNLLISSQSRDIARESKRDSSAMKAIALLTMWFLPGTFVAAFFAMPLFNWNATHWSSVVGTRFWIYWAVTVPATAMVLVLWRVWFKFDHWRMMKGEADFWGDAKMWWYNGRKRKVVLEEDGDGRSLSTLSSRSYGSASGTYEEEGGRVNVRP